MVWKKLTTEEYISKCVEVHGDTYGYDCAEYLGCFEKVKIYCKKHKEYFLQTASAHTQGRGCKRCGDDVTRKSTESFIEDSKKLFGSAFDYSNTEYKGAKITVELRCIKHNQTIHISPNRHLSFKYGGCEECANEGTSAVQRDSLESVVRKIEAVHGDKFLYDLVEYKSQNRKIKIICKEHGVFTTKVASLLLGHGCPSCAKYGFDQNKEAVLYLLSISGRPGEFTGFGVTNKIEDRLKTHIGMLRKFGFAISEQQLFHFSLGTHAVEIEQSLKSSFELSSLSNGIVGFKTESTTTPFQDVCKFVQNYIENNKEKYGDT